MPEPRFTLIVVDGLVTTSTWRYALANCQPIMLQNSTRVDHPSLTIWWRIVIKHSLDYPDVCTNYSSRRRYA